MSVDYSKEVERVSNHNERARGLGLPATLTIEEWLDTLAQFQYSCAYCLGPFEDLDHFIPVSLKGGTTKYNCVPACGTCNTRKQGRHPGTLHWINPSNMLYVRSYLFSMQSEVKVTPKKQRKQKAPEVTESDNLLSVEEVSERLNVSTKTIYRYLVAGMFENVVVVQRLKRVYYRFSEETVKAFKRRYSQSLPSEERPKRVYNRRVVKGKHSKKRSKKK